MRTNSLNYAKALSRIGFGAATIGIGAAVILPTLAGHVTAAPVTSRRIVMSNSTASATSVSYNVVFNPGTSTTVGGIVVDFCANTPIIGDTSCTLPAGFTMTGTPAVTVNSGMGTGWTVAGLQGGAAAGQTQVVKLSHATPQSLSTATPVDFTITTATNPSNVNTSFYARIYTFNTAANMDSQYTASGTTRAATFANGIDSGGVALSTAAQVTVTSKVQETLSFCVYTDTNADPAVACTNGGTAAILGDTNGVLSTAGPFVAKKTRYNIATNAGSNAVIRFKAGLPTSGGNTIASIGATATTPVTGTSQFGLCTHQSAGSGLTASAP